MVNGFHANDTAECKRFINEPDYLIWSQDRDYLGGGMYFWEHKSNAEYWKNAKKSSSESAIVSAEIITDSMLDLTDDDICEMLDKCMNRVNQVKRTKLEKEYQDKTIPLGKKLDYLFDGFPLMGRYSVVRGREYKERKSENIFLIGTTLTTKAVDIYSVRKPEVINKKEWVA